MARMPDGFVFITNVSGPKVKDGQAYADVSVEERELVMCKSCKYWAEQPSDDKLGGFGICNNLGGGWDGNEFCSDGERRDDDA